MVLTPETPAPATAVPTSDPLTDEVEATREWMSSRRFDGITRLHTPRQVVEQRDAQPSGLVRLLGADPNSAA